MSPLSDHPGWAGILEHLIESPLYFLRRSGPAEMGTDFFTSIKGLDIRQVTGNRWPKDASYGF